jgi:hypothetical protein
MQVIEKVQGQILVLNLGHGRNKKISTCCPVAAGIFCPECKGAISAPFLPLLTVSELYPL